MVRAREGLLDSERSQPRNSQIEDPELLAFLEVRIARTSAEFGVDPRRFPRPILLLHRPDGPPETIRVAGGGSIIFLKHKDDWQRARYQLAHEVVHNVLSTTVEPVFDWVQEMFAVHVAVRAMRELGEHRYASRNEAGLWEQSYLLTREQMMEADLENCDRYPDGLYGQVFVTGLELIDQIGWERLKLLGTQVDENGRHDVAAWLDLLERREQESVKAVLARD